MLIPRCGTLAVSFLPQILQPFGSFLGSWGGRRIDATLPPSSRHKYGPAVGASVMKRLPESS